MAMVVEKAVVEIARVLGWAALAGKKELSVVADLETVAVVSGIQWVSG